MRRRTPLLVLFALLAPACASIPEQRHDKLWDLREDVSEDREILDEWTNGPDERFVLVAEGRSVQLYRIAGHVDGRRYRADSELTVTIDLESRTCSRGQTRIDCGELRNDPHLAWAVSP